MVLESSAQLADQLERDLQFTTGDKQSAPLWHYTTEAGLRGILSSRVIRGTSFDQLNDRTEVTVGQELVREAAEDLRRSAKGHLANLWAAFLLHYEDRPLTEVARVFVASFCEEDDALSMWREYANKCAGYAIGLATLPYENLDATPGAPLAGTVVKMRYERANLRTHFRDVLRQMGKTIHERRLAYPTYAEALWKRGVAILLRRAASLTITAKHHSFNEEKEWRIVGVSIPGRGEVVKKDPGGRSYVDLPLVEGDGLLPLVGVRLGPLAEDGQRENAIGLLRSLGYPSAETMVSVSGIPLRRV
jgi:hypothetical protein